MLPEEIKKIEQLGDKDFSFSQASITDFRESWRIFRIMAEFVEGYNFLAKFRNEVTILGSARLDEDNKYNKIARQLGKLLAENGFTTITGGGPGIMEAANRGAFEGKGESLGLNIQLPFEQRINPYVTKSIAFYYFFTRKVLMTSPANAFVYFPGGFGTMDEFFEVVDSMELNKMQRVPIVLVGKEFWTPLVEFLEKKSLAVNSIKSEHLKFWQIVDTAEEAFELIKNTKDKEGDLCEIDPQNFHCEEKIDWKVFRIMAELVEGFEFLTGLGNDVTVLGTKGIESEDQLYLDAYSLGKKLAENNYATITGGGPGIMEGVNKGAFENGGESIGINMRYGFKERVNAYVKRSIGFQFPFTRKLIIMAPSKAFVFFPGGFGTLHQLFEVLTLIQTKKVPKMPVILYNHAFWEPLHKFIKEVMVHDLETIGDEDDELYQIVDDVDSVMKIIEGKV